MNCSDCGLPLNGAPCEGEWQDVLNRNGLVVGKAPGHVGICCDCFDERLGMPSEKRLRPRPL